MPHSFTINWLFCQLMRSALIIWRTSDSINGSINHTAKNSISIGHTATNRPREVLQKVNNSKNGEGNPFET